MSDVDNINGKRAWVRRTSDDCAAPGCEKGFWSKGYCSAHYHRLRNHGSLDDPRPTLEQRFWSKVEQTSEGCWRWTGGHDPEGYGSFRWRPASGSGTVVGSHRAAYRLLVGEIPGGIELDHTCHNDDVTCKGGVGCPHRLCVNPDHLEPVTQAENARRRWAKHRSLPAQS